MLSAPAAAGKHSRGTERHVARMILKGARELLVARAQEQADQLAATRAPLPLWLSKRFQQLTLRAA